MSALTPLEEFQKLQAAWFAKKEQMEATHAAALLKSNASKNRYMDILACDQTRVVLREFDHDYINANFIKGHDVERAYIGAQAPLQSTMRDFWHMVWQEAVMVIVMLTREVERGCAKADQYWPDSIGESSEFAPYTVTLLDEDRDDEIVVRRLELVHTGTQQTRTVSHVQYTAWPDHGVPPEISGVLHLLQTTNQSLREAKERAGDYGPMVVHCSAGVGRTGTFIAAHIAAQQIAKGQTPSLYEIVDQLREQRRAMVQTRDQYGFIHQIVDEMSKSPQEYALSPADTTATPSDTAATPSSS